MHEADQVFYEEIREKKSAASGAHGRKGKRGRVGKMVTPADLAGPEYREARELPGFNVYDFIDKLQGAPTLKAVLLGRMDEEYQNYRRATEKTLDAVVEIVRLGLEPVYRELARVRERVEELAGQAAEGAAAPDGREGLAGRPLQPLRRKRIRWGSTPEAIRATVFRQCDELIAAGEELSTETIKQRVPSMLRWIYGERAVFQGIEGLRREFWQARGRGDRALRDALQQGADEEAEGAAAAPDDARPEEQEQPA